jgi:hypothetical protein
MHSQSFSTVSATESATNRQDAATEHIVITFCNIDWKRSHHNSLKTTAENLHTLRETIDSIRTEQRPAVICLCELGKTGQGMTEGQVTAMISTIKKAWSDATQLITSTRTATERTVSCTELEAQNFTQQPYLTV